MTQQYSSPVIITGMHRSGTSIVTRLLGKLGLMTGVRKDRNDEAIFFQHLNKWILSQCDGSWEHPGQIHYILNNNQVREVIADYLRYMLKTPHILSYVGLYGYLRSRSMFKISQPWGWKDPRNTFTLPLWLEIFPDAKVINVYRHGLDIAQSLKTRHDTYFARSLELHERRKRYYWLRMKSGGFATANRSATIEGAFALWEEYMEEDIKQSGKLGNKALRVKYEDFLESPRELLRKMALFCGLDFSEEAICSAAAELKPSRRFAYLRNKELAPYAEKYKENLHRFGY